MLTNFKVITIILIIFGMLGVGYVLYNNFGPNVENNEEKILDKERELSDIKDNSIPKDWSTFEDQVAGYKIKYPSEWNTYVADTYTSESVIESFDRDSTGGSEISSSELKIAVRRISPDLLGDMNYNSPGEDEVLDEKAIKIAGESATWRKIEGLGTSILVELKHGNDMYVISAYPADSKLIEQFDLMLKTFEFASAINVETPRQAEKIDSPLTISGQAPGSWFFEGVMKAELRNMGGTVISQISLTATQDWTTSEPVPFTGTLEFTKPAGEIQADLVIKSANPSGLSENERTLSIPVAL